MLHLSRESKISNKIQTIAAGLDMYAAETVIIQPKSIKIPKNMRGKVSQRANKLLNETKIEKCILGKQLKTIKYPAKMSTYCIQINRPGFDTNVI